METDKKKKERERETKFWLNLLFYSPTQKTCLITKGATISLT